MKDNHKIAKNLSLILLLAVLIGLGFCSFEKVYAAGVPVLNTVKKTIYVGNTYQLSLKNAVSKVNWESSDTSVALVLDTGRVVGVKKGKTTITATYEGYKYNCVITVKKPSISKNKATLKVGKKLKLKVKGDSALSWKSSDDYVAKVSDSGNVTAVGVGTAKITVKCESGKTYTCKVTVKSPTYKVGDVVTMGKCEQDNNQYNGEEPMEWIVIATENDKALLVSKYIIFENQFNSNENVKEPYWENCTLRQWLNETVYNTVFKSEEKKVILQSVVTADINPESKDTAQGQATKDYLFCLSVQEVYDYGVNATCSPVSSVAGTNYWLTRSRDYWNWGSRYVGTFNGPYYKELEAKSLIGVRPAMWIKMM